MWITQTSVPGPRIVVVVSILVWQGYLGSLRARARLRPLGGKGLVYLPVCVDVLCRLAAPKEGKEGCRQGLLQEQQASDRISGPLVLLHNTMVEARPNVAAGHGMSCPRR